MNVLYKFEVQVHFLLFLGNMKGMRPFCEWSSAPETFLEVQLSKCEEGICPLVQVFAFKVFKYTDNRLVEKKNKPGTLWLLKLNEGLAAEDQE